MKASWIQVLAALGVSAWAATSSAEEAAPRAVPIVVAPAPKTESQWYGWQTLITDGAALTLGGLTLATAEADLSSGVGAMSVATYALGGPIVHFAHGNVGRGFASMGIRTAAPIVSGFGTAFAGMTLECAAGCDGELGGMGGFLIGGVLGTTVGVVGASVIDATLLAREEVPVEEPRAQSLRVVPNAGYDPKRGAASVGLTGSF